MAQFKAFESGIDVNGQTILSVVNALSSSKDFALEILSEHGIKDINPDGLYSQQSWLDSFKTISQEVGANVLFSIGKAIPENAIFPPGIDSIDKALGIIDVAFHMNHFKNGAAMFNPENGTMQEGIGHYSLVSCDSNSAIMKCNNPYPCDFDRGIITTMARKFKPLAEVKVDSTVKGRNDGTDESTYIVSW